MAMNICTVGCVLLIISFTSPQMPCQAFPQAVYKDFAFPISPLCKDTAFLQVANVIKKAFFIRGTQLIYSPSPSHMMFSPHKLA